MRLEAATPAIFDRSVNGSIAAEVTTMTDGGGRVSSSFAVAHLRATVNEIYLEIS